MILRHPAGLAHLPVATAMQALGKGIAQITE
jgi:hypothetical protein